MKQIILASLLLYKKTKIFRKPTCRFYPSCSIYMTQAIEIHGLLKGLIMGSLRLLRCHPLHKGGIDEVPAKSAVKRGVFTT